MTLTVESTQKAAAAATAICTLDPRNAHYSNGADAMSAVDCPLTTLAPTDSTVCTAAYTVVPGDASASRISNTAEAVASYSVAGAAVTVTAVASTAVVTVDPALGLALTGTSSPVAWLAAFEAAVLMGGVILLLERRRRRKA